MDKICRLREGGLLSGSDGREKGERWVFSILGRRRGDPRWVDDPVVAVAEAGKRRRRGRRDIVRQEERLGRAQ